MTEISSDLLSIGEVVRRSGKAASSVRYYEEIGLLPELGALIERIELVRAWLEDAAHCFCATLEECPLFEPSRLPPRQF
jgi:hypothetical protein